MNFKLSAKKLLGCFGNALNLLEFVSRKQPKSIVLGYHRIIPYNSRELSFCLPGMYVTIDTFKRHINFLQKYYKLVHLRDLVNTPSSEMYCAITFDDGWLDNYLFAYPILKELAVPATIFLTTGFIEKQQWPWPDRLMFYDKNCSEYEVLDLIGKFSKESQTISIKTSLSILDTIMEIKKLSHSDIIQLMAFVDNSLASQYTEQHKTWPALSWDNIREMSEYGVDYGLHSHRHIIANKATPTSLIEQDYNTSAKIFQSELGYTPTLFAYPNGNYNNKVIRLLKKMNINISVTTESGFFNADFPMTIKRILVHEDISASNYLLTYRLLTSVCFNGYFG